jgi:hypothetical protein
VLRTTQPTILQIYGFILSLGLHPRPHAEGIYKKQVKAKHTAKWLDSAKPQAETESVGIGTYRSLFKNSGKV